MKRTGFQKTCLPPFVARISCGSRFFPKARLFRPTEVATTTGKAEGQRSGSFPSVSGNRPGTKEYD